MPPTSGHHQLSGITPDSVELWLPTHYERFPGEVPHLDLPEGVTLRRSNKDYGPATKILPAVRRYRDRDVQLVYCDDDILYTSDFLKRLSRAAQARPDCCIAERGFEVSKNYGVNWRSQYLPKVGGRQKGWTYRAARIASLGIWKPANPPLSGFIDIAEGFGGVLVRPALLPDSAFDIPQIAMKADDIWLSGQMALNSVPIWQNVLGDGEEACSEASASDIHGLKDLSGADDRQRTHPDCVSYMQREFGIWGGARAAPATTAQSPETQ